MYYIYFCVRRYCFQFAVRGVHMSKKFTDKYNKKIHVKYKGKREANTKLYIILGFNPYKHTDGKRHRKIWYTGLYYKVLSGTSRQTRRVTDDNLGV